MVLDMCSMDVAIAMQAQEVVQRGGESDEQDRAHLFFSIAQR